MSKNTHNDNRMTVGEIHKKVLRKSKEWGREFNAREVRDLILASGKYAHMAVVRQVCGRLVKNGTLVVTGAGKARKYVRASK